jgi:hypothetical protein
VNVVFAPVAPGVTAAGVNVYVALGGRFDALIVTGLVNGAFTELTTML